MERVGFTMRLLPGQEAEYRRRHAAVWPEMLDALRAAGLVLVRRGNSTGVCRSRSSNGRMI